MITEKSMFCNSGNLMIMFKNLNGNKTESSIMHVVGLFVTLEGDMILFIDIGSQPA